MMTRIWTIGHSTGQIDRLHLMRSKANGIKLVADVRMLPGSKRHPQFNRESLAKSLGKEESVTNIFRSSAGDGNRNRIRTTRRGVTNAFRGYADYMETKNSRRESMRLARILARKTGPTAIMCAEAVWWRCHRALISDYLKVRGVEVMHILDREKLSRIPFTSRRSHC